MNKVKEIIRNLVDRVVSETKGCFEDEYGILKELESQAIIDIQKALLEGEGVPKDKVEHSHTLPQYDFDWGYNLANSDWHAYLKKEIGGKN